MKPNFNSVDLGDIELLDIHAKVSNQSVVSRSINQNALFVFVTSYVTSVSQASRVYIASLL